MSEQEKQEIISELEQRFEQKYKGCFAREDTQTTLKAPREKWFRDGNGGGQQSLMAEAFNSSIISWQVWEVIRKLTCVICGKQYVRHLADIKDADAVAERLCQFVYDLKREREQNEINKSGYDH